MLLMSGLLVSLCLAGVAGVRLAAAAGGEGVLLAALLIPLAVGAAIVGLLMHQVKRHLLVPMAQLYTWALSMCDGDLSARIPPPRTGQYAKFVFHINRLSEALERLANEMDEVVWGQTERLHVKNESLEVLYEVAAAINASDDLDELLGHSARWLMGVIGARSAIVRLRDDSGAMRPVSVIDAAGPDAAALPARDAGEPAPALDEAGEPDGERVQVRTFAIEGSPGVRVSLPLHYHGRDLGELVFETHQPEKVGGAEVRKLLESVGKHLGMAVVKARLDEESRNLTLIRERNSLAHELHDSLAQTLAGLRFQVKMLKETLDQGGGTPSARREVTRIESSLDEANTELRELIANFRAPVDERGLLPALEDLVARFRRESGIATYFQTECAELRLPAASEMQVLGIVREALTNARKHSRAQTVRILLRCETRDEYTILVEDDGVGVSLEDLTEGHPGEHIGLSIMEERAHRLGGDLRIESEPGEGLRVELTFGEELLTVPGARAGSG
jgi:two-component system nitrate/nitrite sensor histidine kinase NarX